MDGKVVVSFDLAEIEQLDRFLIKQSKKAVEARDWQEAEQFIIFADKLADAKEAHYQALKEKPASEVQTFQG